MSGGRFRLGRRRDGTEGGISNALHESFQQLDQEADDRMMRLIEQMKDFEGTRRGGDENGDQS